MIKEFKLPPHFSFLFFLITLYSGFSVKLIQRLTKRHSIFILNTCNTLPACTNISGNSVYNCWALFVHLFLRLPGLQVDEDWHGKKHTVYVVG